MGHTPKPYLLKNIYDLLSEVILLFALLLGNLLLILISGLSDNITMGLLVLVAVLVQWWWIPLAQ